MRYLRGQEGWGGNDKKLCLVINVLPLVCENQQTNEIFSGTLLVSYGACTLMRSILTCYFEEGAN